MSQDNETAERDAATGECARRGHDWSQSADSRVCRRCSARSHYGSNPCHNGHDWSRWNGGAACRRCGVRVTDGDQYHR